MLNRETVGDQTLYIKVSQRVRFFWSFESLTVTWFEKNKINYLRSHENKSVIQRSSILLVISFSVQYDYIHMFFLL